MRTTNPWWGQNGSSKHYLFGSQNGSMGDSVQSRNPNISAAENVINTILDVFFLEISKEIAVSVKGAGVPRVAIESLQDSTKLLGNPHFHILCEALKNAGDHNPLQELRTFVTSALGITMLSRSINVLRVTRMLENKGMSVTKQRYFNFPSGSSVEEAMAVYSEGIGVHHDWLVGSIPQKAFKSVRDAVEWGFERVKPFQPYDFQGLLARIAKNEKIADASRSDAACERAQALYKGLVRFAVDYAPLIITQKEIERLLVAHQLSTLEEAGRIAEEAVFSRLTAARDEVRAHQALEAERLTTLGQARMEEYRKEAAAAQRAEEARVVAAEQARLKALRDFHVQFQEVELPEAALGMLEKLESGSGIPASLRRHGELIVTRVLNPLRYHLLDRRGAEPERQGDPAVEKFAALVFSPTTIAMIAKSFGLDPEKCLHFAAHSGRSAAEGPLKELCHLYESSPAVRGMVQTMLDQADGIIVIAALALPPLEVARYANDRDWNGIGVDRTGRDLQGPLGKKLRRVIEDKIVVRVAREGLPEVEPIGEKRRAQIEIPSWIDEVVNRDEFAYTLAEGQLLIVPREAPTLAMYVPTKGFSSKETFQREYKQRLNQLLSEVEVEKRVAGFAKSYGFSVSEERDERGRRVTLLHPEYEISATLEGFSSKWQGQLDDIEQRFHQSDTSWRLLLERAERAGFEVLRDGGGIVLSHPILGEHSVALGAFAPVRQLHRVTVLVDDAERKIESKLQEDERRQRKAVRVARVLQSEVLPGPHDEIVMPDANVFMSLGASRQGGRTWLDLLNATAALKHVRMMVPAVVADFELTGRIIPFESIERSAKTPSMLSWTSSAVQAFREFFEGATRIKIERRPDGALELAGAVLGTNRNLVIVESPEDDAFYERVRALEKEAQGNTRAFHELVRSQLYHAGEGDAAITRFLKNCPFSNRVTVITSDVRYLREGMPLTTGRGAPVSGCSIGSYVAAECDNRGEELAEVLASSEPIHFHVIAEDVSKNPTQGIGRVPPLFPFLILGRSAVSGLTPQGIQNTLRER